MHETDRELHAELEDRNDAELMLRRLEKRLLKEPYFNPPVEVLLDFWADVESEHFDQRLAVVTDPIGRADLEDMRKNWEMSLRERREKVAEAQRESGEDWRRLFAVRHKLLVGFLDEILLFERLRLIEYRRASVAELEVNFRVRLVHHGSTDEARLASRRAHDMEFERIKLLHGDLLRSRIGNLLPLT
jgi:hypothetical protein